nr:hypothetical protein [Tanacetum cinerariifolium]
HKAAMIHRRDDTSEEDMPPQRRFVFTAPSPGCDVAESSTATARAPRGHPGHDARTIARVADRVEESAEDLAVTQMMRIYALEVRARTDTVEDPGSSC